MKHRFLAALATACLLLATASPALAADGAVQKWLENGRLDIHLRSFLMDRDFEGGRNQQTLAVGGWLLGETAPLAGLSLGGAVYTSQGALMMDADRFGANLLTPNQDGYTVLGQLYLKGQAAQSTATVFRQILETPFLNSFDVRMTPITYEAYTVVSRDVPGLTMTASWVAAIKPWAETTFKPMTEAAGIRGGDDGVAMAGLCYEPTASWRAQLWEYYANQYVNIVYAQVDHTWKLGNDWGLAASLQGFDQRDVGEAQGGVIQAWQGGAQVLLTKAGLTLSGAFTITGPDSTPADPWSGYPGFTSIMEEDNNRADDKTWLVGLGYDFGAMGPGALKTKACFTDSDTPDSGPTASPDQQEVDLTVEYILGRGALKDLSLKARGAAVWQDDVAGGRDYADFRFIINYQVNLLK